MDKKDINRIARLLTEDPDIFNEAEVGDDIGGHIIKKMVDPTKPPSAEKIEDVLLGKSEERRKNFESRRKFEIVVEKYPIFNDFFHELYGLVPDLNISEPTEISKRTIAQALALTLRAHGAVDSHGAEAVVASVKKNIVKFAELLKTVFPNITVN